MISRVRILLLASFAVFGCGSLVQSGGFQVYEGVYDNGAKSAASQTAFATSCPVDQVQTVVLAVDPNDSNLPTSIGASACGKRLVFARVPGAGNWVLNSDSGADKPTETAK